MTNDRTPQPVKVKGVTLPPQQAALRRLARSGARSSDGSKRRGRRLREDRRLKTTSGGCEVWIGGMKVGYLPPSRIPADLNTDYTYEIINGPTRGNPSGNYYLRVRFPQDAPRRGRGIKVAGVTHNGRQVVLAQLNKAPIGTCRLRPEPGNPHDPHAVAVVIDNHHVGYIPARRKTIPADLEDTPLAYEITGGPSAVCRSNCKGGRRCGYYTELLEADPDDPDIEEIREENRQIRKDNRQCRFYSLRVWWPPDTPLRRRP